MAMDDSAAGWTWIETLHFGIGSWNLKGQGAPWIGDGVMDGCRSKWRNAQTRSMRFPLLARRLAKQIWSLSGSSKAKVVSDEEILRYKMYGILYNWTGCSQALKSSSAGHHVQYSSSDEEVILLLGRLKSHSNSRNKCIIPQMDIVRFIQTF
ncbi:hypothetical protein VTL71DRAFT_7627, partial [Oculimacula yallundae]